MRYVSVLAIVAVGILFAAPARALSDTKYAAALDALQDLDSAASVGLNARQFNERVITVKIKVDKLGNNPRYKLMKQTARLLVDASILWDGSIAGSLPQGSLQGLRQRNASDPYAAHFLSELQSEDAGNDLTKEFWKINTKAAYKSLFLTAQVAMAEVLGKAPKGSFAKQMAASKKAEREKVEESAQPVDLFGWGETRWGMTDLQVEKILPDKHWKPSDRGASVALSMIEPLVVAGKECALTMVYTTSSSGSRGLERIELGCGGNVGNEGVFAELKDEYGRPSENTTTYLNAYWRFRHTTIKTQGFDFGGISVIFELPDRLPSKGDL